MAHTHDMTTVLATLLVAHVCAEWVEISQQHYRKPIRTHHPFTTPDKLTDVEETTKPWAYSNSSVAEYNWSNSKPRNPNIGNIKRVQHVGNTVRTTERVKFEDKYPNLDDELEVKLRPNYEVTKKDSKGEHSQKDIIERVPYISNGNRVYVGSNPKMTESKFEDEELNFDADIVDFEPRPYSFTSTESDKYKKRKNTSENGPNSKANRIYVGSTVKTTERIKYENQKYDLDVDFIDYELKPYTVKTSTELNDYGKQNGTTERIPSIGNVKRVELNNSPVKSPVMQKGDGEKISSERHGIVLHSGELQPEVVEFEHNKNLETFNQRIYIDELKKEHSDEKTATFPPDDKETSYADVITMPNSKNYKEDFKNYTDAKDLYLNKPTHIADMEDFSNYETHSNENFKNNNKNIHKITEENNVFTTEVTDTAKNIITKIKTKPNHIANNEDIHENYANAESADEIRASENDKDQENLISNDQPNTKVSHTTLQQDDDPETLNLKTDTSNQMNITKENTMENFIKFMKVVADIISKNSRRSFGSKMQYLHELKDSILANIEERIESTWPDDDSPGTRRRSRSAHATGRGHVHFPSSESALMTISFLTFAVFLIKLVLQVIQTYKNKTMMVAPLVVAAGRSVFSHHGHH